MVITQIVITTGVIVGAWIRYRQTTKTEKAKLKAEFDRERERLASEHEMRMEELKVEREKLADARKEAQAKREEAKEQSVGEFAVKNLAKMIETWEREIERIERANLRMSDDLQAAQRQVTQLSAHVLVLTQLVRDLGGNPPPMPEGQS